MVVQRVVDCLVRGSNPGPVHMLATPPMHSTDQDSNRQPQKQQPAALPFYRGLLQLIVHPHCLEPSAYKLLHHALGYAT